MRSGFAMRRFSFVFLLLLLAAAAGAEEVTVTFSGTVSFATLDLGEVLSGGETLTGSIAYESTTAGVYIPPGNPTFERGEMLYTGAVTDVQVHLGGTTASGSSGDIEIFDATEMLAGNDSWEATTAPTTGGVAGVAITSFLFNSAFPYPTSTLTSGDPLPAPADEGLSASNQFSISSVGGGTAYGSIDSFEGPSSPPVPTLPTWATIVVGAGLACFGIAFAAKQKPRV